VIRCLPRRVAHPGRVVLGPQVPQRNRDADEQQQGDKGPAEHADVDGHQYLAIDSPPHTLKPAAPRRWAGRRAFIQRATMPSPPTAFGTVTEPIAVSDPSALTLKASTMPAAPACT
jgi:hypothetical protein